VISRRHDLLAAFLCQRRFWGKRLEGNFEQLRGCQYLIRLLRPAATEEYYQLCLTVRPLELTATHQGSYIRGFDLNFLLPHSVRNLIRQILSGSGGYTGGGSVGIVHRRLQYVTTQ
jgi:hypothetical protein